MKQKEKGKLNKINYICICLKVEKIPYVLKATLYMHVWLGNKQT